MSTVNLNEPDEAKGDVPSAPKVRTTFQYQLTPTGFAPVEGSDNAELVLQMIAKEEARKSRIVYDRAALLTIRYLQPCKSWISAGVLDERTASCKCHPSWEFNQDGIGFRRRSSAQDSGLGHSCSPQKQRREKKNSVKGIVPAGSDQEDGSAVGNQDGLQLLRAANPWKRFAQREPLSNDPPEHEFVKEIFLRKMRGILNKLTNRNVEKLANEVVRKNFGDRDERLDAALDLIFQRAAEQPCLASTLASLMHAVCQQSTDVSMKLRKKVLEISKVVDEQSCQEAIQELEMDLTGPLDGLQKDFLEEELVYRRLQLGRAGLRNVAFIGNLYEANLLNARIILGWLDKLLGVQDNENLECFCRLMAKVGQKLTRELGTQENQDEERDPVVPVAVYMEVTLKKISELIENPTISAKVRFALMNIKDLINNNWKPRLDPSLERLKCDEYRLSVRQAALFDQLVKPLSEPLELPVSGRSTGRAQLKKKGVGVIGTLTVAGPLRGFSGTSNNTNWNPAAPNAPIRADAVVNRSGNVPVVHPGRTVVRSAASVHMSRTTGSVPRFDGRMPTSSRFPNQEPFNRFSVNYRSTAPGQPRYHGGGQPPNRGGHWERTGFPAPNPGQGSRYPRPSNRGMKNAKAYRSQHDLPAATVTDETTEKPEVAAHGMEGKFGHSGPIAMDSVELIPEAAGSANIDSASTKSTAQVLSVAVRTEENTIETKASVPPETIPVQPINEVVDCGYGHTELAQLASSEEGLERTEVKAYSSSASAAEMKQESGQVASIGIDQEAVHTTSIVTKQESSERVQTSQLAPIERKQESEEAVHLQEIKQASAKELPTETKQEADQVVSIEIKQASAKAAPNEIIQESVKLVSTEKQTTTQAAVIEIKQVDSHMNTDGKNSAIPSAAVKSDVSSDVPPQPTLEVRGLNAALDFGSEAKNLASLKMDEGTPSGALKAESSEPVVGGEIKPDNGGRNDTEISPPSISASKDAVVEVALDSSLSSATVSTLQATFEAASAVLVSVPAQDKDAVASSGDNNPREPLAHTSLKEDSMEHAQHFVESGASNAASTVGEPTSSSASADSKLDSNENA